MIVKRYNFIWFVVMSRILLPKNSDTLRTGSEIKLFFYTDPWKYIAWRSFWTQMTWSDCFREEIQWNRTKQLHPAVPTWIKLHRLKEPALSWKLSSQRSDFPHNNKLATAILGSSVNFQCPERVALIFQKLLPRSCASLHGSRANSWAWFLPNVFQSFSSPFVMSKVSKLSRKITGKAFLNLMKVRVRE